MQSTFVAMVAERDPALAAALPEKFEQLRARDRALVEAAERELAEIRRNRPRFVPTARDESSVEGLFDPRAVPDPDIVAGLIRSGRLALLVVDRLEGRHHG
jgi:hypothetical protein